MFIVLWMVECRSNSCCTLMSVRAAHSIVEYECRKGVPADLPNTSPHSCRPQMALQDVLLSSRSASAVCERPILRAFAQAALLQFLQRLSKTGIDEKGFTGGFSLVSPAPPFTA